MPNVAPDSVTVLPLAVAVPFTVMLRAVVPACTVFVHEVGVVTVPALADGAVTVRNRSAANQTGSATSAAVRRRQRSDTACLPLVARAGEARPQNVRTPPSETSVSLGRKGVKRSAGVVKIVH